MAAFRILDPFPAYQNSLGDSAAGGSLKFYETGTTTPKNVYGDKALTVNNGSTVALDASGRTNVDVWGDGAYRVRLYDSLDVLIDEADNVELPGGAATALPALVADEFLTSDGSVLSWAAISQLPDMTGAAGKILGTDGTLAIWQAIAAAPPVITTTGNSFRIGTVLFQFGNDNFPAATVPPYHATSKVVTFPIAFDSVLGVHGMVNKIGITSSGHSGIISDIHTTTTATFNIDINATETDSSRYITATTPFSWMAVGIKA